MEDKKFKQEIDTNKFISHMEHPTNEEIKKEIEVGLKSKIIPDEIKELIKSKFYNIEDNSKDLGEEYDRFLVNLLSKKRKDFKYLQAIFLIINHYDKNEILKKEGIVPDFKNEEERKQSQFDNDWYIDIQIDLIYNDNTYYHKYVKRIINELFILLNKEFLMNYIKLDFTKKGESYYKNNKEEFLSGIISLFEKLNNLTKIIDKNETKRKKKKKKNKNKNLMSNKNIEDSESKNNENVENIIIDDKMDQVNNNNLNNDKNNNIEKSKVNEIKDEDEKSENNNKIIIKNKGDNMKNKIWMDSLKLNREELELVNNLNDKSLKKEINLSSKIDIPENHKDSLTSIEIKNRFLDFENQINELKSQNKIQSNQISECQEKILKLQNENEKLKNFLYNSKSFKKLNYFILKKIIDKYVDRININKEGENIEFNFIEDINDVKINELNIFTKNIYDKLENQKNETNLLFKNIKWNEQFDSKNSLDNILEKLLTKEEIKELSENLFEGDYKIKNYIIEKFKSK